MLIFVRSQFLRFIHGGGLSLIAYFFLLFNLQAQNSKSQKTSAELWELFTSSDQKSEPTSAGQGLKLILPPTYKINQVDYVVIDALAVGDPLALATELQQIGALKVTRFEANVSALVPVAAIPQLNSCEHLIQAQASMAKTNSGATKSNGDISLHSQEVRSTFQVNGLGYKIGILSDSYNTLFGASSGESTGDLPGPNNPNGFLTPVEILEELDFVRLDEGRAMAEIIHDIAPAAQLSFQTGFMGQAGFAQGILDLADAGCDIIVDDIIYFTEPYFQDGIIAQAIDQVSARGIPYFSAVGNYGSSSYESVFRGAGVFEVAGMGNYKLHDFDPGSASMVFQKISLAPGARLELFLQWDEPFASACTGCPGSRNDVDFFLFSERSLAADKLLYSRIGGNKGSNPVEGIQLTNNNGQVNELYLVIGKVEDKDNPDPDPRYLKYIDFGNISTNHIEFGNNRGTSIGHTNAAEAISVGASLWYNTPEFNSQTPIPVINDYSSAGEVPIFFDPLGNRLVQPEIRISPEVIGPDGVNTTFFSFDSPFDQDNFPNFSGTSAAAPHLAASAALLMELADRRLNSEELRALFRDSSVDMNDPNTPGFDTGYDFKTGYGFARIDQAAEILSRDGGRVIGFTLVDAENNQIIGPLRDQQIIDLTELNTQQISILANTDPLEVGSIYFELTGTQHFSKIENLKPYALFGDNIDDFFDGPIGPGDYQLKATPFSERKGKGVAGSPTQISFSIQDETEIIGLTLVNAETGEDIFDLAEGLIIDLSQLDSRALSIRARTQPEILGSVKFELFGNDSIVQVENIRPYALLGDSLKGQFFRPWFPERGSYQVIASPFSSKNTQGLPGLPLMLNIAFIDPAAPALSPEPSPFTIKLFPNPNPRELGIQVGAETTLPVVFELYDGQGNKILERRIEQEKNCQIPLPSSIQDPVYIARFKTKDKVYSQRILIK